MLTFHSKFVHTSTGRLSPLVEWCLTLL